MSIQKIKSGVISDSVSLTSPSVTGNLNVTQSGTPVIAQFNRTDAGAGLVVAADSDGPYFRATAEGDAIRFNNYLNNSEHARFNGSGYLGLGTTNPQKMLHVNGQVSIGETISEKWLNPVSAYYISGGTINRNIRLISPGGEYYAIFYIVGIWPYAGDGYGTRIIEVTGYGDENRFSTIRNTNYGGGSPTAVTLSATGSYLNINITYNSTYRFACLTKLIYGNQAAYVTIDGTNQ
jgi:hypothetical protein